MQVSYLAGGIVGVVTLRWRAHAAVLNAVAPLMFVSSMYRSLITIQYPKCIQRVSKWYRKTIQYRSPDGAKNVSCSYRASIEQKVSRYCIESRIDEITIHVRYTTIHYDTLRYMYGEKPPRYMGKMALSPLALARSEHCRAVWPGEASVWSPPGSHNSSRLATGASKRAYGPKGASWCVGGICEKHVLHDLGRTGQQN